MNKSGSSFDSKSCYRLYAGHSNWINLNAKTTQDLLKIFQKGEPCRYQLEPGLFIDIIPNDVDCNSKNIDMIGLMRADLVYDSQQSENQVQQQMSHYVRSLLDEQGIIDTFPPLRKGEELPIITALPTHRHLSLVPSVVGTVRRGPKSNQIHTSLNHSKNPSSASSVNEDHGIPSSSSSSSLSSNSRKKNAHSKRATKRARQLDYETSSKRQLITLGSPNMVNTSFMAHCSPMLNEQQHSSLIPIDYHNQHHQHHHHQQQQQSQVDSSFWEAAATTSAYQHAYSHQPRSTSLPFEMDLNFEHTTLQHQRHSPTDILNDYNNHGFSFHNNHGYPQSTIENNHKLLKQPNNQHFVSSDTNSLESYVPTSPIPNWLQDEDKNKQQRDARWAPTKQSTTSAAAAAAKDNNVKTESFFTDNMTTLPVIERLMLQQQDSSTHENSIIFSHANREEPTTTAANTTATTTVSSP